jgi:integrase
LAKLEPGHVSGMLGGLTARGDLSPTTVGYTRVILRAALNRVIREGKVLRNVAVLVDPPAKVKPDLHPLTADQVRTFIASLDGDRMGPLYITAIGTGLRQGELLALRWSDVDLDAGSLTVKHALNPKTRVLAEPKTDRARRTLRLGREVVAFLRDQRRQQVEERLAAGPGWSDGDFVFTSPSGRPLDGSNVTHAFGAAITRAGLPHQRFHDLRHCAATMLLEQGVDIAVVSRVLGHASMAFTMDVYGHLTPRMSQDAADRMDAVLRPREAVSS